MLDALWFVLGGMAVVFAALGLLMVVMLALNRWLRPQAEAKVPPQTLTSSASSSEPKPEGQGHA